MESEENYGTGKKDHIRERNEDKAEVKFSNDSKKRSEERKIELKKYFWHFLSYLKVHFFLLFSCSISIVLPQNCMYPAGG